MSWVEGVYPVGLQNDLSWARSYGDSSLFYLVGRAGPIRLHYSSHTSFFTALKQKKGWSRSLLSNVSFGKQYGFVKLTDDIRHRFSDFGENQAEYIYQSKPMRLDAIVMGLYGAKETLKIDYAFNVDGRLLAHDQLAINPALFAIDGLNHTYFKAYLLGHPHLDELFEESGLLRQGYGGTHAPTFEEMARGLPARYRTCEALKKFAAKHHLPPLGEIIQRPTTNGTHARQITGDRKGEFSKLKNHCCVELLA